MGYWVGQKPQQTNKPASMLHKRAAEMVLLPISHVADWVRKMSPTSIPCYLWWVRELTLGSQDWEN